MDNPASPDPRREARRTRHLALAVALLVTGWAGPARAICASSVDPAYLDSVLDDPRSLLRQNPRGGEELTSRIRQLAVQGTRALKAIGTILPTANAMQKDAIGRGFANAAGACSARSPVVARQITELVRTSADRDVTRVYARFFSATDDAYENRNATLPIVPYQDRRGQAPNLSSGLGPKALPLGDPFAKP